MNKPLSEKDADNAQLTEEANAQRSKEANAQRSEEANAQRSKEANALRSEEVNALRSEEADALRSKEVNAQLKEEDAQASCARKPKVAVIVTEYRFNSHADVIAGRLLGDLGYEPRVEVVSMYTDQVPHNDMSRELSEQHGYLICETIDEAIRAGSPDNKIDGVVIIGEHGDYPWNEKGQHMYPRRRLLEEVLLAMERYDIHVPIFSDKHFSYDMEDAIWMYEEIKRRGILFLAGSSVPHTAPVPPYDQSKLSHVKEMMVASYGNKEAYGYHALEVLQSVLEKRAGGETGISSIQAWGGDQMWQAMEAGEWPADLLEEALSEQSLFRRAHEQMRKAATSEEIVASVGSAEGTANEAAASAGSAASAANAVNTVNTANAESVSDAANEVAAQLAASKAVYPMLELVRASCKEPLLYRVNYKDGTKGYVAQLDFGVNNWSYSLRLHDGEIIATECGMDTGRPFKHFATLTSFIEDMIIEKKLPFNMERVYFSTLMIRYALESLYVEAELATPELDRSYQAYT